ncbi:methylated-DNA--[protein]-cysteine S-methyltransferase [Hymenobacter sp. YC55]|uniref:methylated-DNA--[protein]-cysteine S-methyltransferase n=1 Tax=Hymenobacter sp. YC55 TaxID=3034019 RepID=UPI0023F721E3|nr:methylated-DNA--[protein]-cysteine S-methyltransferase [Hymenobacter sp. YC55]MDF7814283.1 methylated-DNA--[protein]-cysteine S-methyltransferase [Hymenobacter sp. YC55]
MAAASIAQAYLYSPLGTIALQGTEAGLTALQFLDELRPETPVSALPECLWEAHRQVAAYFNRELRDFQLVYAVPQGTEFQRRVWTALSGVGFGRTASYLDLARQLGNPGAVRAVGAANGQNPLGLVWPCHRIIGANGQLTGYAGGLWRKKWLLEFEQPAAQGSLW